MADQSSPVYPEVTPPSQREVMDVLNDLMLLKPEVETAKAHLDLLYLRRDMLLLEGREGGFDPPISQSRLAKAFGVEEVTVTAALRRIGARRQKQLDAAAAELHARLAAEKAAAEQAPV